MEPAFLKNRSEKQLSRLKDFIARWIELGELVKSGKDRPELHALRRDLAELAQTSVYSLPEDAKNKTREITGFLEN